jgi:hypothetical protein
MSDVNQRLDELKESLKLMPEADREQVFNCIMILKLILRQWGKLGGVAFTFVSMELHAEIEKEQKRQRERSLRVQHNGH